MKKLFIYIESNDNDDSNNASDLLKANLFPCEYELVIKPEYPFMYNKVRKPMFGAYYANSPVYAMCFFYHFEDSINDLRPSREDFNKLEAFVNSFEPHVRRVLTESNLFKEKIEKTKNESHMKFSRFATDLHVSTMRAQIDKTQTYNPQMFHSAPKKRSKTPYILIGLGVVLGICAFVAPGWVALGLALVAAVLLIAGSIALKANPKTPKFEDCSSPSFSC